MKKLLILCLGFLPILLFSCSQAGQVETPTVGGGDPKLEEVNKTPLPQIIVCTKVERLWAPYNPDAHYFLLVQYTDGTSLGYQRLATISGSSFSRYTPVGGAGLATLDTIYRRSILNVDPTKTIGWITLAAEYRIAGFSNDYINLPINGLAAQQLADGVQMYLPVQTAYHVLSFHKPEIAISSGWYC